MVKQEEHPVTRAAVLVVLVVGDAGADTALGPVLRLDIGADAIDIPLSAELILTVRAATVEHHSGEISFPGGAHEPGDASLAETALRECEEEIGLRREAIRVLGELPDVPTVASRFLVRPFVGIVRGKRPNLILNPRETASALFVPLAHLLDPRNSKLETYERRGARYKMRAYDFGEHRIWGATALMIEALLEKKRLEAVATRR